MYFWNLYQKVYVYEIIDTLKISFFSGLKWHEFKWEKYINKDLTKEDIENPLQRFRVNLVNSIKIGVNRTIPDHR